MGAHGMIYIEEIKYFAEDNQITLYWDRPKKIRESIMYDVWLNGVLIGSTKTTHFTIKNLCDSTRYDVCIQIRENDNSVIYVSDTISISTRKKKHIIDVTKAPYMAVGDGKTLNTNVLQQAFDDCTDEDMIYIPKGVFMTGALTMHSGMEIYIEEDAILQGTDEISDYLPKIKSRFEGIENMSYSSLLNMGQLDCEGDYNCSDIVIRGKGTIASGGKALAERVISHETELLKDYLAQLGDKVNECEKPETIPGRVRPRLINMSNCQNIRLSGLTLKNGASWNVHMIYSDDIVTNGCTFYSEGVWNGDGWDPDSSTNCSLFDCVFYTGDDSVAIKSGKNPEGNIINRPTSHIRIFDCKCACGNGIAMGSEMSGGISDVKIWDCDLSKSFFGVEIKGTKKRGGYVREVEVYNCKLPRVLFHSVGYNDDGIGADKPPVFENCTFEKLYITGKCYNHKHEWQECDAIEVCGFNEPGHELKNIIFSDICIEKNESNTNQRISIGLCENISFEKIRSC